LNLLFERRAFHLLVILTKLVTGQAREPLTPAQKDQE